MVLTSKPLKLTIITMFYNGFGIEIIEIYNNNNVL